MNVIGGKGDLGEVCHKDEQKHRKGGNNPLSGHQKAGGKILACGTCLKIRGTDQTELCPLSSMKDMHAIITESDRLLTF